MEEPPGDDVAAVSASLLLPGPTTFEAAEAEYAEALGPLAMGEFDASAPGAYNSHFASMSRAAEGDNQQKMRRLGKELRDLRGKQRLPVGAAAAHFVRQDLERPDKVGGGWWEVGAEGIGKRGRSLGHCAVQFSVWKGFRRLWFLL